MYTHNIRATGRSACTWVKVHQKRLSHIIMHSGQHTYVCVYVCVYVSLSLSIYLSIYI